MNIASRRATDGLLSVVLPVYNERAVLGALAGQVEDACRQTGLRYELVFVNDGSRDGSALTLDELALRSAHIRVVHLSRNFGHQAALQAGLAEARGDAVVIMDADLQDTPSAIVEFVDRWRAGVDVVYAIRTERKESAWKRAAFRGFYRLLSLVADRPLPLDAGNFGLLDRRVVDQVLQLAERDRYFPGLRHWVGYAQVGVPVERQARYDSTPRVSLLGLWRLAKTALFGFSTFPLAVFYTIGYTALAIFVALAGYSLFCKVFTNLAIPGWTSHILSASFFGALNALGISMLGEYVVRIYDQVRGRPLYIVARRAGPAETAVDAPGAESVDESYHAILAQAQEMLVEARAAQAEAPPPTAPPPTQSVRKPTRRAKAVKSGMKRRVR